MNLEESARFVHLLRYLLEMDQPHPLRDEIALAEAKELLSRADRRLKYRLSPEEIEEAWQKKNGRRKAS